MPKIDVTNLGGLNLALNPLLLKDGDLIRSVNVDGFPIGSKTKRAGYNTYLGTADGSAVTSLFSWTKNDGSTLYTYRTSGSSIYYSTQGTGDWTLCGNGTISPGAHVGFTVLDNTLVVGDGIGSTRHTTNGTAFTNTSLAPIASEFEQFQNRVYAMGTSSTKFYSTTGDATNWSTTGTSDSSSIDIPGAGKLLKIYKLNNRVFSAKNSGEVYRWDGFNLVDLATNLGPTSPYSFAKTEDYGIWLNWLGFFGSGGDRPQILSNAIQRQIYNDKGSGIAGTAFAGAAAAMHRYDYLCAVGTVTDDLTDQTVVDCIEVYNYQTNLWTNYKFANFPTTLHSFKDANGVDQLIFGDSAGQVYQRSGTATTDNGSTIESIMEFVVHAGEPMLDKKWNWFRASFNPGCMAKVQIACENVFTKGEKRWIDLGDARNGIVEYRFPQGSRSKFVFVKIYEASKSSRFTFNGFSYDCDVIQK